MTDRLIGKTALITGAASGIGKACAERFVREEAHVVVTDIDKKAAQEVRGNLTNKSLCTELDVRKPDHCQHVADETLSRFGRLDIPINNAGIALADNPEISPIENLRKTNSVNGEGVLLGCQMAIPWSFARGGEMIL